MAGPGSEREAEGRGVADRYYGRGRTAEPAGSDGAERTAQEGRADDESRRSGGSIGPALTSWPVATAQRQPQPRSQPRVPDEGSWQSPGYRSGNERASGAQVAFGIGAVSTAVLAFFEAQGFGLIDRAERFELEAGAWLEHLETLDTVARVDDVVWQGAGIALIVWLSRYVDNIPALGGGIPKRSPRRTIVYWLVPIINFIFLPLILRDAGRRMAAGNGNHGNLIATWWLFWVGWFVPFFWWLMLIPEDATPSSERQSLQFGLAVDAIFIIQAILTIVMIRRMQADETHWAGQGGVAPGSSPPRAPGWADDLSHLGG